MKKTIFFMTAMVLVSIVTGMFSCTKDKPEVEKVYTVTFDADGGNPVPAAQDVKSGEKVTAPTTNPSRQGYVFLFWRLKGVETAYNFQTAVTGNITLQAKWETETKVEYWQVTWELNGGAWPANDNHAKQVAKGGTLAEPNAPTITGGEFEGWYRESALTNKVTFPYNVSSVTSDFTLYAKWISTLPALTGTVAIIGSPIVGSTLTANVENLGGTGNISYQWKRCDSKDAAGTNITPNGTGSTYTLTEADIDKFIKVTVNRTGYSGNITSTATETVTISPYFEYFGTWRLEFNDNSWEQVTISADKIEYVTKYGSHYNISGLTWTETENPGGDYTADYPAGYKITGTSGTYLYMLPPKADGSGQAMKGDIAINTFYISADKTSIITRENYNNAPKEVYRVYHKRTDIEYWQITYNLNGGEWMAYNDNPITKVAKDGSIARPDHPVKGDIFFKGWSPFENDYWSNESKITFPYSPTGNLTLYAGWSDKTYLQEAVYSMGYAIQIGNQVRAGLRPDFISEVLWVRYNAARILDYVDFYVNRTYASYWSDNGLLRPETISGTVRTNSSTSITNGTYNYKRDWNHVIAHFDQYQPNNPYISLSNLQKITNNSAITQTIYDNIRGVLPSYSYKMIVFGINSKKELMGKYIGYSTDGKQYNYWCIDPASPDFGKFSFMNSPIY